TTRGPVVASAAAGERVRDPRPGVGGPPRRPAGGRRLPHPAPGAGRAPRTDAARGDGAIAERGLAPCDPRRRSRPRYGQSRPLAGDGFSEVPASHVVDALPT